MVGAGAWAQEPETPAPEPPAIEAPTHPAQPEPAPPAESPAPQETTPTPPVPQEPPIPAPPPQETPATPPAPPAPPAVSPAPEETPAPTPAPKETPVAAPEPPPALKDRPYFLRAALQTRGDDKSRVGVGLSAEMRSPLPWDLLGGPGIELDLFQSQSDSNAVSFLPVYWGVEYRALKRFPNAFLAGRLGFDMLGQEGDDTMASRTFYAASLGLVTHLDRAKAMQWELIYSRMRGAFPGIGISVGYRY